MSSGPEDSARRSFVGSHLAPHAAIGAVLLLTLLLAIAFVTRHPTVKPRGDEEGYARIAHLEYAHVPPPLRLLPGGLQFHYWPPLTFALYSYFGTDELGGHYREEAPLDDRTREEAIGRFIEPIAWLHVAFLLIATTYAYRIGRTLGLEPRFAALAAGALSLNPRVMFYVQALWPELLHLALFLPALFYFLRYLRTDRPGNLAASSLLFAYSAFTKGVATYYVLLLVGVLLLHHRRQLARRAAWVALAAFALPFLVLNVTQRACNVDQAGAMVISSNAWVNIEKGVVPTRIAVEKGYENTSELYHHAADTPVGRERASRERLFEYVAATPWHEIAVHLFLQYRNQPGKSFLNRGLYTGRWRDPRGLMVLEAVAACLSWAVVVLGLAGAATLFRRDLAAASLALFLLFYMGSLFLVGWNERFLVQALPALSIFGALSLQVLARSVRAR